MTTLEFFVLLGALAALFVLLGALRSEPSEESPRPPPSGRWRRFRVDPVALCSGSAAQPVISEVPPGLVLSLCHRGASTWELETDSPSTARPDVRIERGMVLRRLRVDLGRRPWLLVDLAARQGFPRLTAYDSPCVPPDPSELEFCGSLRNREYEVRLRGRLVASVSWQQPLTAAQTDTNISSPSPSPADDDTPADPVEPPASPYFVEILKNTDDAHALLALVCVLEIVCDTREWQAQPPA